MKRWVRFTRLHFTITISSSMRQMSIYCHITVLTFNIFVYKEIDKKNISITIVQYYHSVLFRNVQGKQHTVRRNDTHTMLEVESFYLNKCFLYLIQCYGMTFLFFGCFHFDRKFVCCCGLDEYCICVIVLLYLETFKIQWHVIKKWKKKKHIE